jgi:hypothetical protein
MNRLWNDVFMSNGWPVQYDITGQFVMDTAINCDDIYIQVTPIYYFKCLNLMTLLPLHNAITRVHGMCACTVAVH